MPSMLPAAAANKATATTKTLLFGILIIIFIFIIQNLFMHGT
jgi:t-SNARE complex subunit (syntaxin)